MKKKFCVMLLALAQPAQVGILRMAKTFGAIARLAE